MAVVTTTGTQVAKERQMAFDAMRAKDMAIAERTSVPKHDHAEMGRSLAAGDSAPRAEISVSRQAADRFAGMAEGEARTMERTFRPETAVSMAAERERTVARATTGGTTTPPPPPPPEKPEEPPVLPPSVPPTEIEGGDIPTTEDEWESRQQWAEYERRQETRKGLRDIAQLREQARLDRARAGVTDRQQDVAEGYSEQALAESRLQREQAGHLLDVAAVKAGDQRREAEIASINIESLEAEAVARQVEIGGIGEQTQAAVDERRAQIEEIGLAASIAMEDTNLAAQRAEAEAAVLSAARGAGGQVVEQQAASRTAAKERQLGRIGQKADLATEKVSQQIKGIRSRGKVATEKAKAAVTKARKAQEVQQVRITGAEARAGVIERQGELDSAAMEIAANQSALKAAALEADAAGLGLDAEAQRVNADFADKAADEGIEALVDRPPIPDWNAIGRNRERMSGWQRASSIVGIVGGVLNIASWF